MMGGRSRFERPPAAGRIATLPRRAITLTIDEDRLIDRMLGLARGEGMGPEQFVVYCLGLGVDVAEEMQKARKGGAAG
jgi:hypothetical protein